MLHLESHIMNASDQFMQSALDALPAHVAILDEHGFIVAVNNAWRRFADNNHYRDRTYGLGANYFAVCDSASGRFADEAPQASRGIHQVLANAADEFVLEYPCHGPRNRRWFVMQVTRFTWDNRPRLIIAHQNVTEIKRVQIELEESRRRLEAILNHVGNGIITFNGNGRLESLNPAALRYFDCDAGDVLGQELGVLFAEPHASMSHRRLLALLQASGSHEMLGRRKDGSTFPMYFAVSELHIGYRRIFTGIVEDLTERKRLESELIEKERITVALDKERELRDFKNRFISMMSHELRTPLSSILLSSDLLKLYDEKIPPEERRSFLDNISTQVDQLTALVKDMSLMARSEVRDQDFAPREADLVAIVRQIVGEYRHRGTHTVELRAGSSRLNVFADLKLVRQIITNLLSNAFKYAPAGTEIHVCVRRDGDRVLFSVTDCGIGIPAEDLPHLFEPFHRGANAGGMPGTGLGLAIVRQSVDLHGGSVEVESEPGKGSTFTVYLPYLH